MAGSDETCKEDSGEPGLRAFFQGLFVFFLESSEGTREGCNLGKASVYLKYYQMNLDFKSIIMPR